MPSDYLNVLLASAANKKKIARTTQIGLTCVGALFLFFLFYIFQIALSSNSDNPSPKAEAREERPSGQPSSAEQSLVEEIKLRLEGVPDETVFKQSANDLVKAINRLHAESAAGTPKELGISIEARLKDASDLLEKIKTEIEAGFVRLNRAFTEKHLTPFMRELASLRRLAPEDTRLTEWVEKESEIKILFLAHEEAQRYRAQKYLKKELRAWKNIVSLGYGDPQITQRIRELSLQIKELAYDEHLKAARQAYEAGNFVVARKIIESAIKLRPKSKNALELKSAIELTEKKHEAQQFVRAAAAEESKDNWEGAATAFAKALKAMPTNSAAIQGRDRVTALLQDRAKLQQLARDPIRLSGPEVHAYAETVIAESDKWKALSPSLRKLRADVKILLERATKKKEIVIESDGKAVIRVRGIGFIQPTTKKTIKLLPGTYELFAECLGHQTELYKIKIPMKGETKPVRVVCGSPL